jgi:hypothetical protein
MAEPRLLRIPKSPLEVELAFAGQAPRRVELYLAEHSSHDYSPERVLDLLEHAENFLPACDLESGEWESFNSRQVTWIGMPVESFDGGGTATELFEQRRWVRVVLTGGEVLRGELLYTSPDESSRVVDLMNRNERFFRLWTEDRVLLVNREAVVRILEEKHGA